MFVNFTLDKFNEIIFVHKLLKINQLKARQTYTERSSFHCLSYLWVNGSRYEGTPFLCCGIALHEAVSWVDACASGVSFWSAPNDSWLSLSLLEELTMIMCSQHAINFPSGMYTNLKQFWFFKKNGGTSPIHGRVHHYSIHRIIWLVPYHVLNILWCHE